MSKLSVVISARNEETKIEQCLKSVTFADEIIVVDNGSTDNTSAIAKKHKAKVFKKANNLMLNKNKNFGFSRAKNEWILNLDADERLTPDLENEILKVITTDSDVDGYWIPRMNILFGKWIKNSIWWPDYQLRLFKRKKGKFPEKHVHEKLAISGKTENLENPMIHQNYDTISQFLYKLDKIYTESEVEQFLASGKKLHWFDCLRMPFSDFLKTFFSQKGYKDGLHGLVLSLLQAFYALVVFAKIWEKQGFPQAQEKNFLKSVNREINKLSREYLYWIYTSYISESKNYFEKLHLRILRKKIKKTD